jgi:hypothetical protein
MSSGFKQHPRSSNAAHLRHCQDQDDDAQCMSAVAELAGGFPRSIDHLACLDARNQKSVFPHLFENGSN